MDHLIEDTRVLLQAAREIYAERHGAQTFTPGTYLPLEEAGRRSGLNPNRQRYYDAIEELEYEGAIEWDESARYARGDKHYLIALGCLGVFFVVFVVGAFVAAMAGNGGGGNEAQKNTKGGGGKNTAPQPELVVSSPSGSPTVTKDSIEVKGEVTPATSKVTVNGEELIPADDGSFSTPLHLNVGENYIQISAEKGSEQADASRTVTREPAEEEAAAQEEAPQVQKNDSSGQAPPANVPPPTVEEQLFAK